MNTAERVRKGIANNCVKSHSYIMRQLEKLEEELNKSGARITSIHKFDADYYPRADITITFNDEELDKYQYN